MTDTHLRLFIENKNKKKKKENCKANVNENDNGETDEDNYSEQNEGVESDDGEINVVDL